MSRQSSGIRFLIDATEGESRRLSVGIEIKGPFTGSNLTVHFPRWVPGSYFLREPIQHMTDFVATDQSGTILNSHRKDVDAIRIKVSPNTANVTLTYQLLATDLSVRSNHLDTTHLHMMPPFTWFMPTEGIDSERMNMEHIIELHAPKGWTAATQYTATGNRTGKGELTKNQGTTHCFTSPNRDEFLDAIVECNPNPMDSWTVEGRTHHLKLWDSGGHQVDSAMLKRFKLDMDRVVKEHHALFGIPPWDNYVTVIQLTEKMRGGLEHLNSQTSMLPRQCLIPGHDDEYRDLVSLFSHEYLHQWNVKRLRPRNFLDYDLQREAHSDLLWWFEGGTSWMGDMLCIRSGAWSEEDWRKDFMRKMKRHTARHGMESESLSESSHDAWIHLYRGHAFSRETQISYYLEGELAIMQLDTELRRRSKGEVGVCDLMAELCRRHAIEYDGIERLGVTYKDIRRALTSMKGGRQLGSMLDTLMHERKAPDMKTTMAFFGLSLAPENAPKDGDETNGWLGLNLSGKDGKVTVTSHLKGSPVRHCVMPSDEIVAVDGLRTTSLKTLKTSLKGKAGTEVKLMVSHEGVIHQYLVTPVSLPQHGVKLEGKGNTRWRAYIATRQSN
ncbi:MAG: M61 family metallopeptidase [Euryarchaeota archaeon]|nr:M61 family metallopeptidase [Euryarchaeota archaeon]MBT5843631.1 M61 family metallopeptidase [Euryarchaeota archaeon]MBT6845180.1 M61 family metallopeptidase [Euryarchaeota archaeon]MBT7063196.1 M61 family metallopeptidase [Euryarchaeota archaeon]MBT7262573.1 M61 family metallopeptidase [Euryarchaeota archaeon]